MTSYIEKFSQTLRYSISTESTISVPQLNFNYKLHLPSDRTFRAISLPLADLQG